MSYGANEAETNRLLGISVPLPLAGRADELIE